MIMPKFRSKLYLHFFFQNQVVVSICCVFGSVYAYVIVDKKKMQNADFK